MPKAQGYLWEKIACFSALRRSALEAAKGKRESEEVAAFLLRVETECLQLKAELEAGTYQPGSYRLFAIYEPKQRIICAAPFRDRVVHHALCAALEPRLEAFAIYDTYACRDGKGTHKAVKRAQAFSHQSQFFLKLDIKKYFESIDHAILFGLLRRQFKDPRVLALLRLLIGHTPPHHAPGKGLPIGNLTSQHFANFYLGHLDHFIKEKLRLPFYLRYMDDMLLFGDDKETLWQAHGAIQSFVQEHLALEFRHERTRLAPIHDGIPFLSWRIWPSLLRLSPVLARDFRTKIRRRLKSYIRGFLSEETFLASLRSLFGHMTHGQTAGFRASFLARLQKESGLSDLFGSPHRP